MADVKILLRKEVMSIDSQGNTTASYKITKETSLPFVPFVGLIIDDGAEAIRVSAPEFHMEDWKKLGVFSIRIQTDSILEAEVDKYFKNGWSK